MKGITRTVTRSSVSALSAPDLTVATLRGNNYNLGLTQSRAPFDGLVTNVPVREGETMVTGLVRSPAKADGGACLLARTADFEGLEHVTLAPKLSH